MVTIKRERVTIPTYGIGEPEKNPMFLEKRVYQGSAGKVYPYPTINTIKNEKEEKEYDAIYIENEYLKIMILPELGGRIQRATDKTNNYDFIYYNQVIKPALVGLTGPWISGGIEFNWPQHHRPTTFLPVDVAIEEGADGSKSVLLHDVDQMYGTKGSMKITLYPGKAYIEVKGQLYNRTAMPQTFLWWANPAVAANEHTQSIFPPDVRAVMDHGKRDVSSFPIATGTYYKQDYSEGVDISKYKNIKVPTSYMAEKSKYDFVGAYDHERQAGLLHVADHHIAPGKKQWTWGSGDFGKAWDENLTDEDGPYIELMTGVFTDNQPDFTWLKPFEEKTFEQYFMPYKEVGQVKNATKEAAVTLSYENGMATVVVYATSSYEEAMIIVKSYNQILMAESVNISPTQVYQKTVSIPTHIEEEELSVEVIAGGECLVTYQTEVQVEEELPKPAEAAKEPEDIETNEELYFTGLHIEQYRHATYLPDPYYIEGLKRDAGDVRINTAYGMLLMRRGQFEQAEQYFKIALKRMEERNPNPYQSEAYYYLALVECYQEKYDSAYEHFYKATWSSEQQESSFYYLAAITTRKGNWKQALSHVEKGLIKNTHNIKARGLQAYLLEKVGKQQEAFTWRTESLAIDPFDFMSLYESGNMVELEARTRGFQEHYLMLAREYGEFGAYEKAVEVLENCKKISPLVLYYKAYYESQKNGEEREIIAILKEAEQCCCDYCFPNKLEDIAVLQFAIEKGIVSKAAYYLGNLYYDKLQYETAIDYWEQARDANPQFATVHRNLALAYYNKRGDKEQAKKSLEQAFSLNEEDVQVFLELDQLNKRLGYTSEQRLEQLERHMDLVIKRDDLYVEYITVLNDCKQYKLAYECMKQRKFHPWEGGEGKITTQYTISLVNLAKQAISNKEYEQAKGYLNCAMVYPRNLGEGKLEGTKDNHILYYQGVVAEAMGEVSEAKGYYDLATKGSQEVAGVMYYNDQPADMILYQGLACLKLGRVEEAKKRFDALIAYGEEHEQDEWKVEYFAVSLPEFMIFEEDGTKRHQAHCKWVVELGKQGYEACSFAMGRK